MSRLSLAMITPTNTSHPGAPNQAKRPSKPSTQSLNHLLNFTLPPRQTHYNQSIPRRARKTGSHHNVWNKEREYAYLALVPIFGPEATFCFWPFVGFVNAQYRFVMNPNGDYTVHFADPDM